MGSKAQVGLEYVLTYSWALVLIAAIVGVLVFVVADPSSGTTVPSTPTEELVCNDSIDNDDDSLTDCLDDDCNKSQACLTESAG